jgi:hypothetical protein
MTVHLLDSVSFSNVSDLKWNELYDHAQNGTLRLRRPNLDTELQRRHDIDSEVELLDWMDSTNISNSDDDFISAICKGIKEKKIDFETGCEGVYNLVELCSVGYWEAWEARSYLYFEKILGIKVVNIEELYAKEIWIDLIEKVTEITPEDYSEIVVMDWMRRREELGETLDEKQDPRILPTMASHNKLTVTLHHLLTNFKKNPNFELILGRDHLKKSKWGHGDWNLGYIIQKNVNFK